MTPPREPAAGMTLAQLYRQMADRLAAAGVSQPRLDARVLIQAALGLDHGGFLAAPERPVAAGEARQIADMIARRAAGEPVSRIVGRREFYGLEFVIGPEVLDPRPETELLVETALALVAAFPAGRPARVLDLGTGSGIVAISLLTASGRIEAVGADISDAALKVAGENARRLGVEARLSLVKSDWYAHVCGRFDLIVSNPPYIETDAIAGLSREVREHDPVLALDGGGDGLDAYRAIAGGAVAHLEPGGYLSVEIGKDQGASVLRLFADHGLTGADLGPVLQDLAGHDRVVVVRRNP